MNNLITLKTLFQESVNRYSDTPFLEIWDGEKYLLFTYKEIHKFVQRLGAGLASLEIPSGEKIALLGENSPGWIVCYLAIVCGGWVVVPLDKELKPKEVLKQIKFSEAKILFISETISTKFGSIKPEGFRIYKFNPFLQESEIFHLMHEDEKWQYVYEEKNIEGEQLASIVFTSGTTGASKGVMLTHWNFVSDIIASCKRIYFSQKDTMLLILPLHHTFALTAGLFCPMYRGMHIVIENNKTRILKVFQEKRPTIMIGVPRLFEVLYNKIETEVKKQGKWEKWQKAINFVDKVKKITGINIGRFVFKNLHKQLGGKVKLFVSGGAALSPVIARKYLTLGIPLLQGWGMTELAPVGSILPFNKWRFYFTNFYEKRINSIGPPLDGLKMELIDVPEKGLYANLGEKEGELVVSGPMLTPGYYKDEESNHKSFIEINGEIWFKTGDVGKKDKEGNFYITGRRKYIIVTPEGKNIHPEEIEEVLNQSPLIQESLILGHKDRKGEKIVAIIAPHTENLKRHLEKHNLNFDWKNIYEVIHEEMQAQLKQIASYKWPSDFAVTDYNEETSEFETFEKTTTLKIKRDLYKFSLFDSYHTLKKGGWRKIFFKKF